MGSLSARSPGSAQSRQELDLGLCMSEKLPGDRPGGQAGMPLRSLPALSFQELEVAEPRYPGRSVPDLSKFPRKAIQAWPNARAERRRRSYGDPPGALSFAAALQGRYRPSLKRTACGSERFSDLSSSHSTRTPASFLSFQLTAHLQGPRFFFLSTQSPSERRRFLSFIRI